MTQLPSSAHQAATPPLRTWRRLIAAVQAVLALALLAGALSPPVHELAEHNVRLHHVQHAALLCGGGMLGLLLGRLVRLVGWRPLWVRRSSWRVIAQGIVLMGPVVVMLLMAPSTSPWTDQHPVAHMLEHLLLIDLAGLIGFCAALLSPAIGWLTVALLVAMAAAFGGMAQAQPPSQAQAVIISAPRTTQMGSSAVLVGLPARPPT